MQPEYKRVKILMPHCPKCNEQLKGNNSYDRPWSCKCGVWRAQQVHPWNFKYEIIKDNIKKYE